MNPQVLNCYCWRQLRIRKLTDWRTGRLIPMAKSTQIAGYGNARTLRFRKSALAFALSQILNLSVPVAMAAMIAVDTDSGGANDPNHCTLRDAITAANADAATGGCPAGAGADTIVLPAKATITLTEPDNPDNGLPVVTSAITIEGNGASIKRDSDSPEFRIFEANNGSLEFRNITINGGHLSFSYYVDGGGIYTRNSPVTLTNSTVSGNEASYHGGVFAKDSPLTLTSSTISENGGIGIYGKSVELVNSTVLRNVDGGVHGESVTLINSTVSRNGFGGFLSSSGISAISATLINSTVSGNYSHYSGGGIDSRSVTLINSTVSGNSTGISGGGIYGKSVALINSTVSGNSANSKGGGIFTTPYVEGSIILTLINSTISVNSAGSGGGGIYVEFFPASQVLKKRRAKNKLSVASPQAIQPDNSFVLRNTIIANSIGGDCIINNTVDVTPTNTNSLIEDGGTNCGTPLLAGDPKLGPLRKNGGPTPTHALLADSPAIDAGDDAICDTLPKNARGQSTDQRGRPRAGPRAGSHCDIGAYELRHRRRE